MAQLLDIFGFISVWLRGLTLSLETMTVGGAIFLLFVARSPACLRVLPWFAASLASVESISVVLNSAILVGTNGMNWRDVAGAGFCVAGGLIVAGSAGILILSRTAKARIICPIACGLILTGSVMNSHAFARVESRWTATALTLGHHVASAAWIGGLLCLLLTLRQVREPSAVCQIVSRFSRLAMVSVGILIEAGLGLTFLYVRVPRALTGTTYGIMLLAKISLTLLVLVLGGLNLRLVRAARRGTLPSLLPLRRMAEAEIGIGFTILLAAASLTSTPPAIDVHADWVTGPEIVRRMSPKWPRMETPSFGELSPAVPLSKTAGSSGLQSFLPGQLATSDGPADMAWSEYNHHWAGLVVLAVGVLSLLARRLSWARSWPLAFFGLAAFLFVRADSENWPLGPRGFWESFQVAEVAQHRLFVLLIIVFAIFEWCVQTGRISPFRAGLVFPSVCAIGGALLLTHSHFVGNVRKEYFAEMSHLPLAMLAVMAGWSRWLEIRLPTRNRGLLLTWIWPVCFILIGAVLITYREV